MTRRVLLPGLAAVALMVAVNASVAQAGLFGFGGGCCEPACCETKCCAPEPKCCCEPKCCEPQCCEKNCCEPECCESCCTCRCRCTPVRDLLDDLLSLRICIYKAPKCCCDPCCCDPACCDACGCGTGSTKAAPAEEAAPLPKAPMSGSMPIKKVLSPLLFLI